MDLSGALVRQTPVGVADLFYEQAAAKTMLEQRVTLLGASRSIRHCPRLGFATSSMRPRS